MRRAAYPALLLLTVVTAVVVPFLGLDPGLATFGFQFTVIAYLLVMERLIPYDRAWHPDRREWGWYGVYFLLTTLGAVVAQQLVAALVAVLSPERPALPLAVEIPLALLAGSLASYLVHRWSHTNPWLWRLHGIHHVPEKVNVANNGVNHVMDVLLAQSVVQLSLSLIGFSQRAVFAVGLFVITQGYFTHANIDVRISWLNYVFASPEQHRLHHSTDLAEAGHFGSDLSVWDRCFGSYTWSPGREPRAVGLHDPASFPTTEAVLASHLQAWRRPAG
ncbi:sterol desaturase family protein [Streptomyces paludis]|uniref:Sterol desaturase family protein n=1 Tax=Streptomyces paludis TaxID=2282738 RepID=A0A345I118_9ACTN|nr:sterol desaturase family protein [Streptomyces paludis]AXG82642.1 sterol desaturase family protein [Streptomyces paludis]